MWSVVASPPKDASPPGRSAKSIEARLQRTSPRILPMLAARATRRPGFFSAQGYGVGLDALASDVTRRLAGAAAGVPSQPPAGDLTWGAASGCGSGTPRPPAALARRAAPPASS